MYNKKTKNIFKIDRIQFFNIVILSLPSFSIMKEEKRKSILHQLLSNNKNHPSNQNRSITYEKKVETNQTQQQISDKFGKSIKRIGAKPTIKSFHVNVDDNQSPSTNKPTQNFKLNMLAKSKSSQETEYNHKQFKKKLKRVGKKVWVSAYKQDIDQKQQRESQNNVNYHLLAPKSPSDGDYFSQFKQSSVNVSSCSNKSKFVEVSNCDGENLSQSFVNFDADQKILKQNIEQNIKNSIKKEQKQNQKQKQKKEQKKYIISINNKQINQPSLYLQNNNQLKQQSLSFKEENIKKNQQINNYFVNIQDVLEQIQKNHSNNHNKRKQSFEIKKCQSIKNIQIEQKKSIIINNKRKSKIYEGLKRKIEQEYKKQQKIQHRYSIKGSKKPLLPAYPFNHQIQATNIKQYIKKRSSNYRTKNLQSKKQPSIEEDPHQVQKNYRDKVKQIIAETPNRMIKSLNNSYHHKQQQNRRTLVQKAKISEHTQMPKITTSIKKSIKYYQMNKYILQAKKQLGKQNYSP